MLNTVTIIINMVIVAILMTQALTAQQTQMVEFTVLTLGASQDHYSFHIV
jgi:hypothetical protein